ncbi:lipopolysaccharide transport periplasmic protein LptA [Noviherbaspirillum sp. CPCC 100848]|uniref:Lipopolysaccharide export system protein LptA n=1 Tax=Noviherbaspirillum album TaxID=3080276 RepID=A0ABU6JEG7_9BURK|nr:lipopolysaccharide transport periplasmic protein LptA [Noviherbaspirillum sp. CPCC 100848]MEC4721529.1 lipopolysaccharide transport periplasmic protein LptA [Noviherbaspirillum sp. CPCC 100848]
MKRFLWLLLMLGITAAGGVHAEKADSEKPTNVEADQMAYDDVKQINTFTGNVILTRGTLIMKAYKLTVTQDPAGYQYATLLAPPGGLATFRQKRDGGPDQWMEGQAERIEYNGKTEIVKLFSRAKMRRLEGTKVMDEVEGEFISYDSRAEFFTVNNTPSGETKPGGGRIKAVIQPRTETKGK